LQEVFLVVHRKLAGYQEVGSMRAWLFTISRQVASQHRRSRMRRERRESIPSPPMAPYDGPHEAAVRREAAAIVHEFLERLDQERALVFFLSDVEGMAATEIASSLSMNLNTVYSRLRATRMQFEEFISKRTKAAP